MEWALSKNPSDQEFLLVVCFAQDIAQAWLADRFQADPQFLLGFMTAWLSRVGREVQLDDHRLRPITTAPDCLHGGGSVAMLELKRFLAWMNEEHRELLLAVMKSAGLRASYVPDWDPAKTPAQVRRERVAATALAQERHQAYYLENGRIDAGRRAAQTEFDERNWKSRVAQVERDAAKTKRKIEKETEHRNRRSRASLVRDALNEMPIQERIHVLATSPELSLGIFKLRPSDLTNERLRALEPAASASLLNRVCELRSQQWREVEARLRTVVEEARS